MGAGLPASALDAVAALPNVVHISPDRPLKSTLDYSTAAVNANVAFTSGIVGTGVGVAIIDSGIDPLHPDLFDGKGNSRIVYSQSFVPGDSSTSDAYGHGTHVAGIVASNAAASTGSKFTKLLQSNT